MTREEQFQLYENAVKAEQKEMEENFERYKKALKKEKPCVERKTVYLDREIVERLNKGSRKIKDIIFDALKEWQMGLRGELENSSHEKEKIKIMMNINEWEKLCSPNYNGISEYLNAILSSYYSRR